MLKQTEAGRATRKKYKSAKEKKRNSTDNRNKTRFSRKNPATNERDTLRYETENTTIEGDDSGICIYPEEKHMNEIQGEGELKVARSDFQKLKIFDKESSDDSLSMISLNSRPTSAVTDFAEEVNLESYEDFSSLENLNVTDQIQMRKTSTESNSSDLEISVDEGSPRIQGIEILEENNLVDEQTEKDNSGNANATLLAKEGEIIDENENKKANVKAAWQLNEKFLLTADFPARIWEEKMNGKAINARRKSSELLNGSFPPLSTVLELRRGSFPISSLMSSGSSRELPVLSGRHCKVKLPTHFPGVPSPHVQSDSESKSSDDEVSNVLLLGKRQKARGNSAKLHKNQLDIPGKRGNDLRNSSTKSSPILSRSHSPMASTENLAMSVASTEYLATRVVTQLDCALQETVNVSKDRETIRVGCVTPNLMPRRYSSLSFRPTTRNYFGETTNSLMLPTVHNNCSKSLPNLTDNKTKRIFVTFDKDLPRAKVVDLEGKSDLSKKCRLINRRLSSEDALVRAMLDKKIEKKAMVKKWVVSSSQSTLIAE